MSGPGKGREGRGKGGARRLRKVWRDRCRGITIPAINRLARRGGVAVFDLTYRETRAALKLYIENVRDYATALDFVYAVYVYALEKMGHTLYEVGG